MLGDDRSHDTADLLLWPELLAHLGVEESCTGERDRANLGVRRVHPLGREAVPRMAVCPSLNRFEMRAIDYPW